MLNLTVSTYAEAQSNSDPIALFAFEGVELAGGHFLPEMLRKSLLTRAKEEGFQGKKGETISLLMIEASQKRHFLLAGLGPRKDFETELLRRSAASLYHCAKKRFSRLWVLPLESVEAVAEGFLLAAYTFNKYKKPEETKLTQVGLVLRPQDKKRLAAIIEKVMLMAEAVYWVRDLVNAGPSDKTPQSLAEKARKLAGAGVTVKVLDKKQTQALGMGSFLGVARGSSLEPYFVHLIYKPSAGAKKRIGLVGKGITFDSGGLSLKTPQNMETMKCDMAGAATVLGIFKVLPRLKVKAEVHGFAPLTYNMPGPDAIKPGDIVRAMNGKTIEILNTDAEGRLILADALAYACRQKLDVLMDLATLTGAVLTALGSSVTGVMTNDKNLLQRILDVSKKTDEPIWELPLVKDYKENIKSKIADLQNINKVRGEAGTIIGGLFLQEFVDSTPWIHFDIAGTAWADRETPYCPPGGTGAMVRTLLEYLKSL